MPRLLRSSGDVFSREEKQHFAAKTKFKHRNPNTVILVRPIGGANSFEARFQGILGFTTEFAPGPSLANPIGVSARVGVP